MPKQHSLSCTHTHTHTHVSSLLSPDDLQVLAMLVLRLFWVSPGGFWELAEALRGEVDQRRVVEHIQKPWRARQCRLITHTHRLATVGVVKVLTQFCVTNTPVVKL